MNVADPAARETRARLDARGGVGRAGGIARAHGIAEPGDLILAGFDDGAQQRQSVSERAQLEEGDAVVRTRDIGEIDAERIVPLPALHIRGRRRERLLRPEPGVRPDARDRVARGGGEASEKVRRQGRFDFVGGHDNILCKPKSLARSGLLARLWAPGVWRRTGLAR